MNKKTKRLIMRNAPYVLVGLLAFNLGEAWRLAVGSNARTQARKSVPPLRQKGSPVSSSLSHPIPSIVQSTRTCARIEPAGRKELIYDKAITI